MKLFIINILLLCTYNGLSQFSIGGKIKNAIDASNLNYATVSIYKDSTLKFLAVTDSIGEYLIDNLENSNYYIKVSLVGFVEVDTIILIDKKTKLDFSLSEQGGKLKAVTVVSKKPLFERKANKLIFNIENSIAAIGTDAIEVISKAPGVKVQRNDIALIGKSKVGVMINDKLIALKGDDLMTYLHTISADQIQKIEIITNPSAKYDAEGKSGLINIILKKNSKKGYNSTIRIGANQSQYFTFNSGCIFNYTSSKLKFTINVNTVNGATAYTETNNTEYTTQNWLQDVISKNKANKLNTRIDIDYNVSKSITIGGFLFANTSKPNSTSVNNLKINQKNYINDSTIITNSFDKQIKKINGLNFFIEKKFKKNGAKLLSTFDLIRFNDNAENVFNNKNYSTNGSYIPNSFQQSLLTNLQDINLNSIAIDFETNLNKSKLEVGSKFTFQKTDNNFKYYNYVNNNYQINNSKSNTFDYKENIQAFYANISREIKKWNFELGVRLENTNTDGYSFTSNNRNKQQYFRIFPNFNVSLNLNDNNIFVFSYGNRIDRPAYSLLNPFRVYSSVFAYTEGNAYLKPSFTDNVELSHTFKNFLTTTIAYTNEKSKYDIITFLLNNNNLQSTTYLNYLNEKNISVQLSATIEKKKWMSNTFNLSLGIINSHSNIPETDEKFKSSDINFSTTNQFIFDKKKTFSGEFSFEYQFPYTSGIQKSSAFYILGAGLKKVFYKKKFQFSINFDDILRSNSPLFYTVVNTIPQTLQNYWDDQRVRFTIRYKIGKDFKEKLKERNVTNKTELDRIKQ